MRPETIAIHGGFDADPATKAVAVPIYQTVSYAFDSAAHGAALFDLEAEGYRYTRIHNPTTAVLETRMAELEDGRAALAVASGQAALYYAFATVADGGGNIVSPPQLYGATHTLLTSILPRQGIEGRLASSDRPDEIASLIDQDTRAVFCESIGNPAGNVCDVAGLARAAHAAGVPLIVDNTVATPFLLRAVEHGADVVVHSLTKYLGGHGTTLGGVIVDAGVFPWSRHAERFPLFNQPDPAYHGLVYAERFEAPFVARCRSVYQRTVGAALAPMSAFLLLQGLETAALRVERHVENARQVAEFLRGDPRVAWVSYAGFQESAYFALVQKYLGGRAAALLTFGVGGGYHGGTAFYDRLQLIKRLVNIGDAKSLACHPASTTHRQMSPEAQARAGVWPEMIRLSVGIEHIDDILADLDQALGARRPAQGEGVRAPGEAASVGQGAQACAGPARRNRSRADTRQITVALVNNMPDAALLATERQFAARLNAAAPESLDVRLALYALPGVPRGDLARAAIRERYASVDTLVEKGGVDAVIVTGCEPRAASLSEEPYWPDLVRLIDWARTNVRSALFSCLAAHAAVLRLDGVERRRAPAKLSGLFALERVACNPLTEGLEEPLVIPHSRHYGLAPDELAAKGYQVLTRSAQAGADMFLREAPSLLLFLQGHPEYEPDTLLREYRRDFVRFVRGEQAAAPGVPQAYFDPQTEHALQAFTLVARRGHVAEAISSFDEITTGFTPVVGWDGNAIRLYRNWLNIIAGTASRVELQSAHSRRTAPLDEIVRSATGPT